MTTSMAESLPLLSRHPHDIIAIRSHRQVTCREFLTQVTVLADALPDVPLAVNLCADRYLFMLAFAAVVTRGQANLLLPSRRLAAVAEALEDIDDCCVLHDGEFAAIDIQGLNIQSLDIRLFDNDKESIDLPVPMIPEDQLAAVVFTSGSTGTAARIKKFWRTFVTGTTANSRYTLRNIDGPAGIISTVPPWHMYGLEYTVLLPLFNDVRTYAGNTLFPDDILSGVERTPVKRILVSTPVHLRALVRSNLAFPPIARTLCATAPLTQDLARDIAVLLATDICELYGCTEAGCLAYRDPVTTTEWTFFGEFSIERSDEHVRIDADYLPEAVTLSDNLEFQADGRFLLQGRNADLVKIGGKRGSLTELTNRLLRIEGVEDAVVFSPNPNPHGDGNEARLTALVVCPGRDIADVRSTLARTVDPVFLPRPLRQVDTLPRNQTGKLRRSDLQRLIDECNS